MNRPVHESAISTKCSLSLVNEARIESSRKGELSYDRGLLLPKLHEDGCKNIRSVEEQKKEKRNTEARKSEQCEGIIS